MYLDKIIKLKDTDFSWDIKNWVYAAYKIAPKI